MSDTYAVVAAHRAEFEVRLMCRVLSVSRAGFYAAQRRAPSADAQADERLRVEERAEFAKARARYGSPRVQRALKTRGIAVGKKRGPRDARGAVGRPTLAGRLYLAIVLDRSSRRVLDWATRGHNDSALALTALERALAVRQPSVGLAITRIVAAASRVMRTATRSPRAGSAPA